MKQLYVCEQCGKGHEDWNTAYDCENSHFSSILSYDGYKQIADGEFTNSVLPAKVTLTFSRSVEIEGESKTEYMIGEYKLVKHLPVLTEEFTAKKAKEAEESRIWHENWEREQAEKKRLAELEQAE